MPNAPRARPSAPPLARAALQEWLLSVFLFVDHFVRTHPGLVGTATVLFVALIALGYHLGTTSLALAMSYAFPIALASYGVGFLAGCATAVGTSALWLLEAIRRDVVGADVWWILIVRLTNSFVVVAMASVVAAAARARERFLEADRALAAQRADLVAAFSHDLRSPLAAISGYAELVQQDLAGGADDETRHMVERILVNTQHLDRLIADMLAAGRGDEVGQPQVSRFAAADLLSELRAEFEHHERWQQVMQVWDAPADLPPLETDRSKLASIVRNLVNNALKFTDRGSVTVRVAYDGAAERHRIDVHDTGPGIPPDALPHVFSRFYRVSTATQVPGFGLGLFIVQRFVDMLGGTVTVASDVGKGTCFTVTIPRLRAPG